MRSAVHDRIGGPGPDHGVYLIEGRVARLLAPLLATEVALIVVLGALVWHATHADTLDGDVARALYARPGSAMRSVARAVTVLGAPGVVLALSLAVGALVWWRYRDRLMAAVAPLSVAIAAGAESTLKAVVRRARPSTAILAHVTSHSFPSGHATASAALAFAVVVLVVAARVPGRRLIVAGALVYAVIVSTSRLVLGVHYLTDVVGGIVLGSLVVLGVAWLCSRSEAAAAVA